jgi:hypothetical protein
MTCPRISSHFASQSILGGDEENVKDDFGLTDLKLECRIRFEKIMQSRLSEIGIQEETELE